MQAFCPECFAEVAADAVRCPRCGADLEESRQREDYEARLIRALRHPVAEVRAGAIEALRLRRAGSACDALVDAALASPLDVDQGLAIIDCLAAMLPAAKPASCLIKIADTHPSRPVRRAAAGKLATAGGTKK